MQHVDIEDVERTSLGDGNLDRRVLSEPLDTSDLAVNYYALDPGDAFSGGLHAHLDQEEVFYVLEGTATFEHKPEPTAESETVEVGPGEAVRFPPGEFQQGRNEISEPRSDGSEDERSESSGGDERLVALALGGPRESTEIHVPQPCYDCDSDVLAVNVGDDGSLGLECPDCGTSIDL
jgi:mannose-6-phosphate isomerase-like protein (cupin superfamily)